MTITQICQATQKVCIFDKATAKHVVRTMRRNGRSSAHAYQCEHCKLWHTSSMAKTEFRRRKRAA